MLCCKWCPNSEQQVHVLYDDKIKVYVAKLVAAKNILLKSAMNIKFEHQIYLKPETGPLLSPRLGEGQIYFDCSKQEGYLTSKTKQIINERIPVKQLLIVLTSRRKKTCLEWTRLEIEFRFPILLLDAKKL